MLSYFMGCIVLVRCVLVLSCGLAGVVWCGMQMQASANFVIIIIINLAFSFHFR